MTCYTLEEARAPDNAWIYALVGAYRLASVGCLCLLGWSLCLVCIRTVPAGCLCSQGLISPLLTHSATGAGRQTDEMEGRGEMGEMWEEGGGGGGRERENSNSQTLFYKDCSLGSVKNLSNN